MPPWTATSMVHIEVHFMPNNSLSTVSSVHASASWASCPTSSWYAWTKDGNRMQQMTKMTKLLRASYRLQPGLTCFVFLSLGCVSCRESPFVDGKARWNTTHEFCRSGPHMQKWALHPGTKRSEHYWFGRKQTCRNSLRELPSVIQGTQQDSLSSLFSPLFFHCFSLLFPQLPLLQLLLPQLPLPQLSLPQSFFHSAAFQVSQSLEFEQHTEQEIQETKNKQISLGHLGPSLVPFWVPLFNRFNWFSLFSLFSLFTLLILFILFNLPLAFLAPLPILAAGSFVRMTTNQTYQ